MRRVVMWVAGGAGLLGGVAALAEEAPAHAYSSEAVMTTITRRQLAVETLLPVVGTRPVAGARITRVVYRWDYGAPGVVLRVQLCQLAGRCLDVSGAREGSTDFFATAPAAHAFYFRAMVPGRGALTPVPGRPARVIVNWGGTAQ